MLTCAKAILPALVLGPLNGSATVLDLMLPPKPDPAITMPVACKPAGPMGLEGAPPEVREFLDRVLEKVPHGGAGVAGYRFADRQIAGRPTREALGLKAIPGVDPVKVAPRIMDVDGYVGNLANVEACRSLRDPALNPPAKVRFYQAIRIPGVGRLQQVLVLVDAGTIKGYRLVYWHLEDETKALDPKAGARAAYNVGAWLVAPGVLGYAFSSCPRRDDVSTPAWYLLTKGANALAKGIVGRNIDGMAAWAEELEGSQGVRNYAEAGRDEVEDGAIVEGSKATLFALSTVSPLLNAPVSVAGGGGVDNLYVSDPADVGNGIDTVTAWTVGRAGGAAMTHDVEALTLTEGTGADTFRITGSRAGTSLNINGGGGRDALNSGRSAGNVGLTYTVGATEFSRAGAAAISDDVESLTLSGDDDTFALRGARAGMPVRIRGGGGRDALNAYAPARAARISHDVEEVDSP